MTIWRMRNARWVPKAANTYSEYVTFIAFPVQQLLHEINSMFRTLQPVSSSLSLFTDASRYQEGPLTLFHSEPPETYECTI